MPLFWSRWSKFRGFVCPATIIQAELWKIGQLKPGNTVRFLRLTLAEALRREFEQNQQIETLQSTAASGSTQPESFISASKPLESSKPE
jgi:urea carboxylase